VIKWQLRNRFSIYKATLGLSSLPEVTTGYELPVYAFLKNGNVTKWKGAPVNWQVNDSYGIEAAAVNSLPKGIWFKRLEDQVNEGVLRFTFLPDGTAAGDTVVVLEEEQNPKKSLSVSVGANGSVNYQEKWN
jgi:hypothetical protein